jgi:[ribosomal protein S18]-alanine N-acetyltransferase
MNGHVEIASATTLDVGACRRLILGNEPWISLGYDDADVHSIVRSVAGANLLVAQTDERTVGFALSASGVLLGEYLKLLVVDPALQSRGIGRRLMAELERRAFQRWPNVYLCVSDFNTAARQFYRRLGYLEVGLLHDLLRAGTGEVLMRKSVAAWRDFDATHHLGH